MANSLPPAPVDNAPPPQDDTAKKKSQAFIHTNTWGAMKLWFKQLQALLKGITNDGSGNITFPGNVTVSGSETVIGNETVDGNLTVQGSINGMLAMGDTLGRDGLAFTGPTALLQAGNTGNQGIANATLTTLVNWTTGFDTVNGFNAATGIYTVNQAGYYLVTGSMGFNSATWPAAGVVILVLFQGAFRISESVVVVDAAITTTIFGAPVTALMKCSVGDTIYMQAEQTQGGTVATYNGAGAQAVNYFNVIKIG